MAVMQRQTGLSWQDTGMMTVVDFFFAVRISEKRGEPVPAELHGSKAIRQSST